MLEDPRDFLVHLSKLCEIPEDTYLVSFNVVKLWSHVTHEKGLEIWKHFFTKCEDQSTSSEYL